MKILVIGDAIIDQYHYCTAMGKSSKEHLVVDRYLSEESFAGGALATANHVAEVSSEVELISVLGLRDTFQDFIESHLNPEIKAKFFYRPDGGTTIKRRFVSDDLNRKLFEICYMRDSLLPEEEERRILDYLDKRIRGFDLVICSDFGHGLLTNRIIRTISSKAKYLALNVQTNSANIGFNLVTKYPHAEYVCMDEIELRFATHDKYADVRSLAKRVYNKLKSRHIVATRGPEGSIAYSKEFGFHETPALSHEIVDKIGAGDAFFAYTAPCFAGGIPQDLVSFIGNAVGSIAVQIVCNREPVRMVDLLKFVSRLLK